MHRKKGMKAALRRGDLESLFTTIYFRKIVVVGDPQPMYTDDCGITYVGLMAFMLDKSILEKVG